MLITTALTACIDESEDLHPQQGTPLQLNVKTASIETRGLIESATLPDGEAHSIGLTLVDDGEATYDGRTYNNIKATPSTSDGQQTWAIESDIYLSSTTGTLYGYYPYSSSVTDITQVPVTAGDTDYMYATPVNNLDDGEYTASVTMNHALAVIRLKVVRGTYTGTGAVTAVSVKGDNIATSGKLNAKTGVLSGQSGAGTAITYSTAFTLSTTAKQIDQIIVSVTSSSAAPIFTATIDGKDYTATPAAVTLAQGTIYEYTLTVNAKEISLSDVKVGDWGYNSSGNPVINAGYNITLAGDIEGIAFSNTINNDGSVTIEAVPKAKNHFVSSINSTGTASVTDALDRSTGIRTITVNSVETDVTIDFTSTYLYINIDNVTNGVYAVTATGELIAYNDAAVDATCLGVALITDNQKIMIEKTENYDATNTTFYWGYNLYRKDVAGITEISTGYGYLPKADGTYQSTPNLSSDYTTWTSGGLSDFNGKNNTNAIITAYAEHSVDMDARDMCKVLQTFNAGTYGSNQGFTDWYIPACGQLALIYLNKTAINEALTAIGGTTFSDDYFWSSSEFSNYIGWYVYFSNGCVADNYKSNNSRVRFVRDINKQINFSITANGEYQGNTSIIAEEGMTWREFINSSYNTYGMGFIDGYICAMEGAKYCYIISNDSYEYLNPDTPIVDNKIYDVIKY